MDSYKVGEEEKDKMITKIVMDEFNDLMLEDINNPEKNILHDPNRSIRLRENIQNKIDKVVEKKNR